MVKFLGIELGSTGSNKKQQIDSLGGNDPNEWDDDDGFIDTHYSDTGGHLRRGQANKSGKLPKSSRWRRSG